MTLRSILKQNNNNQQELTEYSKIINRFNRHFMRIDFIILSVLFAVELLVLGLHYVGGGFLYTFGFTPREYFFDIIIKTFVFCALGGTVFGTLFIKTKPGDELYENIPFIFCEYITIVINSVFYMFPVLQLMVLFAPLISLICNDQLLFKRLILDGAIGTGLIGLAYQLENLPALPDFYIYNIFYVIFSFGVIYKLGTIVIIYEKEKETKFLIADILNSKLEEQNENLENDINTDGLTRINNFRALSSITKQLISESEKSSAGLMYCMLDIDDFKKVNDVYGHEFGNTVLRVLGGELKSLEKTADGKKIIVARYGGEEFGILFEGISKLEAYAIVEDLRQKFGARSYRETPKHFTFSAGIAAYTKDMDENALFQAADEKLYQAKQTGKNKTCI